LVFAVVRRSGVVFAVEKRRKFTNLARSFLSYKQSAQFSPLSDSLDEHLAQGKESVDFAKSIEQICSL
jgi:hypothetical protein